MSVASTLAQLPWESHGGEEEQEAQRLTLQPVPPALGQWTHLSSGRLHSPRPGSAQLRESPVCSLVCGVVLEKSYVCAFLKI